MVQAFVEFHQIDTSLRSLMLVNAGKEAFEKYRD